MVEANKPLNRDEIEAAIRHFDKQIMGIREGMLLSDYDPGSESARKAEASLQFYLQQKKQMVNYIKSLDSTDAF